MVDDFSQGTMTLQYLTGKVRLCGEEISALKREASLITTMASECWKGEAATAFTGKMDEVSLSLKTAMDEIENTLRLLNATAKLVAEDEEKNREKAKAEAEREEGVFQTGSEAETSLES